MSPQKKKKRKQNAVHCQKKKKKRDCILRILLLYTEVMQIKNKLQHSAFSRILLTPSDLSLTGPSPLRISYHPGILHRSFHNLLSVNDIIDLLRKKGHKNFGLFSPLTFPPTKTPIILLSSCQALLVLMPFSSSIWQNDETINFHEIFWPTCMKILSW